jgi:tetratricopeptide (TPR) repeat protein
VSRHTPFLCLLLLAGAALAQPNASRHDGRIEMKGPADNLWVELYDLPGHFVVDRQPVARDGSFTVTAVAANVYELRVLNARGERLQSDTVQFRQGQPVEVRLAPSPTEGKAPAGPVSAKRLAHKPTKPAQRLVNESVRLAEMGDIAGSAGRLEKAVALDPAWFEAWNNLGTKRIALGQYDAAAAAFRKALEIDENSALVLSNLALAHLFLRRPAEAESFAARAMQWDPASPKGAYVLALALLQQDKRTPDALAMLEDAAGQLPRARLALAEWLCRHSELNGCATHLRAFLKTPKGPNHENAARWMKEVDKALSRQRHAD